MDIEMRIKILIMKIYIGVKDEKFNDIKTYREFLYDNISEYADGKNSEYADGKNNEELLEYITTLLTNNQGGGNNKYIKKANKYKKLYLNKKNNQLLKSGGMFTRKRKNEEPYYNPTNKPKTILYDLQQQNNDTY